MEEKKKVLSLIAAKLRSTTYWQILRTMVAVADPWEGPGDPGPPLFLDQTEARRADNNFFAQKDEKDAKEDAKAPEKTMQDAASVDESSDEESKDEESEDEEKDGKDDGKATAEEAMEAPKVESKDESEDESRDDEKNEKATPEKALEASRVEKSDESEDDESEDEERTTKKTMKGALSHVGKKDTHDEKDNAQGVEAPSKKRERIGDSDKAPPSKVRKEQKVDKKRKGFCDANEGEQDSPKKGKKAKESGTLATSSSTSSSTSSKATSESEDESSSSGEDKSEVNAKGEDESSGGENEKELKAEEGIRIREEYPKSSLKRWSITKLSTPINKNVPSIYAVRLAKLMLKKQSTIPVICICINNVFLCVCSQISPPAMGGLLDFIKAVCSSSSSSSSSSSFSSFSSSSLPSPPPRQSSSSPILFAKLLANPVRQASRQSCSPAPHCSEHRWTSIA